MMACWKQNEFRDEACRKEIQDFFDCASRAEVTEGSWVSSWEENGGGDTSNCSCLLLGDRRTFSFYKSEESCGSDFTHPTVEKVRF